MDTFIDPENPTQRVTHGSERYNTLWRQVLFNRFNKKGWTRRQKDALRTLKKQVELDQLTSRIEKLMEEVEREKRLQTAREKKQKERAERRQRKAEDQAKQKAVVQQYQYEKVRSTKRQENWSLADSPEEMARKREAQLTIQTFERQWKGFRSLKDHVMRIFNRTTKAFKIDFSFTLLLRNVENGEYRMFYNAHYHADQGRVFDHPRMIAKLEDVDTVMDELKTNIEVPYMQLRESTKWAFIKFVTYKISVSYTDINMGSPIEIPDWILGSRYIVSMKDTTDNLCFWACLYFGSKAKQERFDRWKAGALRTFASYYGHSEVKGYGGVSLQKELPDIEVQFQTAIDIWKVDEFNEGKLFRFRRSDLPSKIEGFDGKGSKLNLLLIQDDAGRSHLCLIRDIKKFAGAYVCSECTAVYTQLKLYNQHQKTECFSKETVIQLPGSSDKDHVKYTPRQTILEKLKEMEVTLPEWAVNGHYPYFLVWDTETYRQKSNASKTLRTSILGTHELMSISFGGNLFKNASHVNILTCNNPQQIVDKFVDGLMAERDEMVKSVYADFEQTFTDLAEMYRQAEEGEEDKVDKLCSRLIQYIEDVPVYGFNSSMYDTNVVKRYIFKSLRRYQQPNGSMNSSRFELEWLNYVKKIKGVTGLSYQTRVTGTRKKTDGFCKETNSAYEALGCFWHGCPKCYRPTDYNARLKKTHGQVYKDTMSRLDDFREKGIKVEFMWECVWRKLRQKAPGMVLTDGIVKTNNKYRSYSNGRLQFKDINAYVAPGMSLAKLYAAYGVEDKGHFPNEVFNSVSNIRSLLNSPLPPFEHFYNSKKAEKDQLPYDEYKEDSSKFRTMGELLEWYNNRTLCH